MINDSLGISSESYASRGVEHYQEPFRDGFIKELSLTTLARIKRDVGVTSKTDGRIAVSDEGDLLVGIVVKNGSGKSQVLLRIDHDEIKSIMPHMLIAKNSKKGDDG